MEARRPRPFAILAALLGGVALFDLVIGAIRTRSIIRMFESHELARLEVLGRVDQVVSLVAIAAVAFFAATIAGRSRPGADRGVWMAAAILAGLASLEITASFASELVDSEVYFKLYKATWSRLILVGVHLGWVAVIAVGAARACRVSVIGAVGVALCAATLAFSLVDRPFGSGSIKTGLWLQFAVFTGLPALVTAAAAWASRRAGELEGSPAPAAVDPSTSPAWTRAADGLNLYRSALIWRIVITFCGYGLLLMATVGKSPGLAKLLLWMLPLAALATGAVMLAGVVGFCSQPDDSPGRGAAIAAAVAMCMALLLDFYVLVQVLTAVGTDRDSYSKIREALEAAQMAGPWAMALSFGALLALLVSLRSVARRFAAGDLMARATALIVWIVLLGGGVVGLRLWAGGMRHQGAGVMLFGAFAVGIVALVVLLAYIGLVRDAEQHLRVPGARSEVPSARLIE